MSDKIRPHHLERKAILYVRQSSAYQVTHNLESQKLQYAMQKHLHQLGWREIEVVDDDLGRSAQVRWSELASSGWSPRYVSGRLVRLLLVKYRVLQETAENGNN